MNWLLRFTTFAVVLGIFAALSLGCAPQYPELGDAPILAPVAAEEFVPAVPARVVVKPPETERAEHGSSRYLLRLASDSFGMHLSAQILGETLDKQLPKHQIDLQMMNHEESLLGLIHAELEAAICTVPLRHRDRRRGLVEHPLGELVFVAVVSKGHPVWSIQQEQLADMLHGELTHWDQLGASPRAIECLVLEDDDPLWKTMIEGCFPGRRCAPSVRRFTNEEVMQVVLSRKPNGVAIMPLKSVVPNSDQRLLMINGVYPSEHMVRTHKYPLRVRCSLVVRKDAPVEVLRFVSYMTGNQARKALSTVLTTCR